MLKLKKKYKGVTMSNSIVGKFNTNDIILGMENFYFNNGFKHIFTLSCDTCEKNKCICK